MAVAAVVAPAEKEIVELSLTDKNRRMVLAFAELFYGQRKVRQAFETYVSDAYIQHNPSLPDSWVAP
jgi:predicted SnoaL-like aldol condensation-catalyzing enzyme